MTNTSLFLTLISIALSLSIQAQDASEIIRRSEDHIRGKSTMAEISIEVERPRWSRTMDIKVWTLGTEYSFILLEAPSRDRGTVFLKRDKEIWNWQPKIEKTIKLPPSMMMQSWMGSDFTNDDLVKESSILTDYTHKIIGDTVLLERPCFIIELTPKPDAPVVWGKILSFIDKKDYLQLASEFYDEDGFLINQMKASKIKLFGEKLMPSLVVMTPIEEEGQKTILRYKSLAFDVDLEEKFFSKQNMKRLR